MKAERDARGGEACGRVYQSKKGGKQGCKGSKGGRRKQEAIAEAEELAAKVAQNRAENAELLKQRVK